MVLSTQFISRITLLRNKAPSFDAYPFSLPAVWTLDMLEPHPKVTFLIGENGSGKSTLLEAIAVSMGFNAEGGSKNFRFGTRESHSPLHQYLRIAKGYKRSRATAIFCGPRASSTWRCRSKTSTPPAALTLTSFRLMTAFPCTSNRTANRFSIY